MNLYNIDILHIVYLEQKKLQMNTLNIYILHIIYLGKKIHNVAYTIIKNISHHILGTTKWDTHASKKRTNHVYFS